MSVQLELIDDATVTYDARGITATRRAIIRRVRGASAIRPRRALEAPGLPRYGDPHPAWGNLQLADIQLTPFDVETWEATLTYRELTRDELVTAAPPGTVIDRQWFATTITEELVEDVNGARLYHFYKGNPLTPTVLKLPSGENAGIQFLRQFNQLVWKNERAEVQRPSVGLRITITDVTSVEPLLPFAGTINANRWSGYEAQTWLVGGMDSREEAGRWLNSLELFYRPETWRFRSTLEYFGAVPDDASVGNGIQFFDVYRQRNFAALGFTV